MTFYSWTGFNGSLADGTEVKPDGSLVRPDGIVVTAADVEAAGGLDAWIKANIAPDGGRELMGMYNEVYCACPRCGAQAEMQIHEMVPGFGQFHIQDRATLADLSADQLQELHDAVREEKFECPKCHKRFNPLTEEADQRNDTIRKLFGV